MTDTLIQPRIPAAFSISTWERVDGEGAAALLHELREAATTELPPGELGVYRKPLPFFESLHLYAITTRALDDQPRWRTFALWMPGLVLPPRELFAGTAAELTALDELDVDGSNVLDFVRLWLLSRDLLAVGDPSNAGDAADGERWSLRTVREDGKGFTVAVGPAGGAGTAQLAVARDGTLAISVVADVLEPPADGLSVPLDLREGYLDGALEAERARRYAQTREAVEALPLEPVVGPWSEVDDELRGQLLPEIRDSCEDARLPDVRTVVRMVELSFYPFHDLYAIDVLRRGMEAGETVHERAYVLWGSGGLRLLGRTSEPIHALNADLSPLGALDLTPSTVLDYVRFFVGFVEGRPGRFRIVENERVALRGGDGEETVLVTDGLSFGPELVPYYHIDSFVHYEDKLFAAVLRVDGRGGVDMLEDSMLGVLVSPPRRAETPADLHFTLRSEAVEAGTLKVMEAGFHRLHTWAADWRPAEPAEFLQLLRSGAALNRLDVSGDVTITEAELPPQARIGISECRFGGRLVVDAAVERKDLLLERCLLDGGITVQGEWGGTLSVRAVDAAQAESNALGFPPPVSILIAGARVAGAVELDCVRTTTGVDLRRTGCGAVRIAHLAAPRLDLAEGRVSGPVELSGAAIGETADLRRLTCGAIAVTQLSAQNLDLSEAVVSGSVSVKRTKVAAVMDLTRSSCGTVTIARVTASRLELSESVVAGSVDVRGAEIALLLAERLSCVHRCELENSGTVWIQDAAVDGFLSISEVRRLAMDRAQVKGRVQVTQAEEDGWLTGTDLRCHELDLRGDAAGTGRWELVDLSRLSATRFSARKVNTSGGFLADSARVETSVQFIDCTIAGKLSMSDSSFGEGVGFVSVEIAGDLNLGEISSRSVKAASWFGSRAGVHVGGNLLLQGATVSRVILRACSIDESLLASRARFGMLEITPGLIHDAKEGIRVVRSRVRGIIELDGTTVEGNLLLTGVSVGKPASGSSGQGSTEAREVFRAPMLRVHGDFRLSQENVRSKVVDSYVSFRGLDPQRIAAEARRTAEAARWPRDHTLFHGAVSARGMVVNGMVDLTGAVVRGAMAFQHVTVDGGAVLSRLRVRGELRMVQCQIRHDLGFHAVKIRGRADLTALSVGGKFSLAATTVGAGVQLTDATLTRGLATTTRSPHLAMWTGTPGPAGTVAERGLRINGDLCLESATSTEDLDLRGLELCAAGSAAPPHLQASHLVVEGSLWLADAVLDAVIPGNLVLVRSRIRHLVLSASAFPTGRVAVGHGPGTRQPNADELVLEDAHIGTLTVLGPPPSPLRLRGLTVQQWSFLSSTGAVRHGGELADGERYINFLAQSPDVHKPLYRAVEQRLYDEGYEDASDAVYKAMSKRDLTAQTPWVRRTIWKVFGHFTAVPRATWMVLAAWFILSAVIFEAPSAVEISDEETRQAALDSLKRASPSPEKWGLFDGMWVALRYHVPVVPVPARERWTASEKPIELRPAGATSVPRTSILSRMLGWTCARVPAGQSCVLPFGGGAYATVVSLLHWLIVPTILLLLSRRWLRRARQNN